MVNFGIRLQQERLRLNLNQDEFGRMAGVTKKTQYLYESDSRVPDAKYLIALDKCGVDVYYVLTGERKQPLSTILTSEEQVMLNAYRELSPKEQKQLIVQALTGVDKKDGKKKAKRDTYCIEGDNNVGNVMGGKHKISN